MFVSEGAATGDVNNDGKTDILAGNYWYEAPSWKVSIFLNRTVMFHGIFVASHTCTP